MSGATANCLYCDGPVPRPQQLAGERFCGHRCRWAHAALPEHAVCSVCGRRLAPHELGVRCCSTLACREAAEEQKRERERKRLETLRKRAIELRDRAAGVLGVDEAAGYLPVVIPASRRAIVNLPERRRRAFRDRLNRLISEAAALGAAPREEPGEPAENLAPAPAPAEAALHGACSVCRGSCCERGGNRAYLNVETMRRSLSRHPRPRPRALFEAYMSHLGNRTVQGSCVFHQAGGCSLPRALRSDTCNRFYCDGLKEFRQQVADGQPVRAFFAATSGHTVHDAAFCDDHGLRPAPAPAPTVGEAEA